MINIQPSVNVGSLNYDKAVRGFASSVHTLSNRTTYPITLSEAKQYCRVDDGDTSQDTVITTLLRSGVVAVEDYLNITLIDCNRRVYLTECDFANIPYNPVKSIISVSRFNTDETGYIAYTDYNHINNVIYFGMIGRYKVEYSAGLSDQAANIPDIYKHMMLSYVKLYFEDRFLFKDDQTWKSIGRGRRHYL